MMQRRTDNLLIAAAALVSGALCALILRNGLWGMGDSWSYWEGSVSLLETGRYGYLSGESITLWPPLFSIYLAGIQGLFGQSGTALVVAMIFLGAGVTASWSAYLVRLYPRPRTSSAWWALGCSMAFVAIFVPLCMIIPLAHGLLLGLLGVIYASLLGLVREDSKTRFLLRAIWLGLLLGAALLTHNSSVTLVGAGCVVLLGVRSFSLRWRFLAAALVGFLAMLPWVLFRLWWNQEGSHPGSLSLSRWDVYGKQLLEGLGAFFFSTAEPFLGVRLLIGAALVLGAVLLFWKGKRWGLAEAERLILLFTGGSALLLYLIFNLTVIDSRLEGRFLWFVPLAIVPVFLSALSRWKWAMIPLCVLALGFPTARVAKWSFESLFPESGGAQGVRNNLNIYPWYFLTSDSSAEVPSEKIPVLPPSFEWMERWQESPLPEAQRGRVRRAP